MKKTSNYDPIEIKADLLDESEKGVKVRALNKTTQLWKVLWLPKSQIIIIGYSTKDNSLIKIPVWLALKNDLMGKR